jgi:hypothetical protein
MWTWMMLGLESNRVIGLRIAKLMRGGKAAQREAQRMVSEKVLAAAKAGTSLMAGASGDKILEQYRRKVAANAKRLSRTRTRRAKFTPTLGLTNADRVADQEPGFTDGIAITAPGAKEKTQPFLWNTFGTCRFACW